MDDAALSPAPMAPVESDGTIAFGTYVGRADRVDWSAARAGPGWRWRRWKRWHYVSVAGPEVVLAVAVVDVGWAGSAFAYVFDRRRHRMLSDCDAIGAPGRAASVSAAPGAGATSGFRSRALHVRLAEDGGRWRLEARSPTLTVDATLEETPAGPTMCVVSPVPGGIVDCTHKTPALRVEGVASAGGVVFDLGGSFGALDHTSGLLAHDTRWRWASATDGRLALNLTEGFTAPAENAFWCDGALHRLGPVTFAYDRGSAEGHWRISDGTGAVDLEFLPEGRRVKRTNLLVLESSYVQPVGTFRGSIDGMPVDGLPGVTEDHVARW